MPPTIRSARAGEGRALGALCVRSKAHWGYDAAFMALSAPALQVEEADIADGRVLVAADQHDRPIGVASVVLAGGDAELGVMFVDPPAMRRGAGRALFEAAARLAARRGARRLAILADPHAAPFYRRMGARFLRDAPSDAIPGRTLPLYEYDLSRSVRPCMGAHR
jgi:GNAT superfamily N-acetyltransferase